MFLNLRRMQTLINKLFLLVLKTSTNIPNKHTSHSNNSINKLLLNDSLNNLNSKHLNIVLGMELTTAQLLLKVEYLLKINNLHNSTNKLLLKVIILSLQLKVLSLQQKHQNKEHYIKVNN